MTPADRRFLGTARTATLATLGPDGRARLVPICFVLDDAGRLYTPLDEKPKRTADPRALARVRDIERRADVTVLAHRWDEDWSRLGWLRCEGRAEILAAPPADGPHAEDRTTAIAALRTKYPQYLDHDLEARPMIRIAIDRVVRWGDLSGRGTAPAPSVEGSGSSSSPGDSPRR
jgi:PPOX class probable F420-dependent enzyme